MGERLFLAGFCRSPKISERPQSRGEPSDELPMMREGL